MNCLGNEIALKTHILELQLLSVTSTLHLKLLPRFIFEVNPLISTLFLKVRVETRAEKDKRKRRDKLERGMKKTEEALEDWNPHEDEKVDSDPFKTLFVARLVFDFEARKIYFEKLIFYYSNRINYDTSESKLKREFEEYGRIRSVSGFVLVKQVRNININLILF